MISQDRWPISRLLLIAAVPSIFNSSSQPSARLKQAHWYSPAYPAFCVPDWAGHLSILKTKLPPSSTNSLMLNTCEAHISRFMFKTDKRSDRRDSRLTPVAEMRFLISSFPTALLIAMFISLAFWNPNSLTTERYHLPSWPHQLCCRTFSLCSGVSLGSGKASHLFQLHI